MNPTSTLILAFLLIPLMTLQQEFPNAQERDPSAYCKQCWERRNQKDYYVNEFNCSTYYHCFKNGSRIEGILRPCPTGMRFDDFVVGCVPMVFPDSCFDPCQNTSIMLEGWWTDPQQCGIFYQCTNFYSIKMCCPPNHRFNKTWGDCMYDKACNSHNDECGKQSITVPMWTPVVDAETDTCHDLQYDVVRKLDRDDPSKYFVILTPYKDTVKNVSMKCPLATNFDLQTCKCSIHANLTMPEKFIDCFLHVEAEDEKMKILDTSFSKFIVDNKGKPKVEMTTGPTTENSKVVNCPGNAHLEVPGIQTNKMQRMTISVWVKWSCTEPTNGSIIAFRSEKLIPVLVKSLAVVKAGPNTVECITELIAGPPVKHLSASVQCDVWNKLTFGYDRFVHSLFVNGLLVDTGEFSMEFLGIDSNPGDRSLGLMINCPVSICEDAVYGGFIGQLDDFVICREAFTAMEILEMYLDEKDRYLPTDE